LPTTWERRHEALKAIHDAIVNDTKGLLVAAMLIGEITKETTEYELTGADKRIHYKKYWKNSTLLLTIHYDYDADGDVTTKEVGDPHA
jgi:hypothetical protein